MRERITYVASDNYVRLDGFDLVHPDVAIQLRRALWQIDGLKDAHGKRLGDSAVSAPEVPDMACLLQACAGDVEDQ